MGNIGISYKSPVRYIKIDFDLDDSSKKLTKKYNPFERKSFNINY